MNDSDDGSFEEEIFPLPALPSALPVTREVLAESVPFSEDPTGLVKSYTQQHLLMPALYVYEEMLSHPDIKVRKQGADVVREVVLSRKNDSPGVQLTFNLNRSDQAKPEVRTGDAIQIDEEHRFK